MKKKLLIILLLALGIFVFYKNSVNEDITSQTVNNIRKIHSENLEKSPFKQTLKLSKSERKAEGLPPNKFYEQEWELTMNPVLGRPTFENLKQIRAAQEEKRQAFLASGRVPGDAIDNSWIERGPNNVGGRTRALMFDPNDATNETVFAGGVSGALWKNTNISNPNSSWTRVDIPENLAVSCITYDPNNTNIFYVGTGESYVGGDVNGDGVWKSVDAGATWTKVFGGISGSSFVDSIINTITINTPSNIAGDYVSNPTNLFGGTIDSVITGELILANGTVPFTGTNGQTSNNPNEGCGPSTIDMTGKIALIRRGVCTFIEKVKSAQDAGAIGAIIMNNVDGDLINMSGDDDTITIPAVMISKADGDIIEAAVNTGTVTGSLNPQIGTLNGLLVPGIQFVNDIKVRNNNGVSEVYVAAGDSFYGAANTATYLTGTEFGLYKSIDNGATWNELTLPETENGFKHCPNDIEIGADNNVWVSTIKSTVYGDGGGKIFRSSNGTTFNLERTIPNADRTQIAVSSTNSEKVFVLAEGNNTTPIIMEKTEDGFTTSITMNLPNDADTGIPSNDFTRGQAYYDLMLEVDPNNDQIIYAGGIDLFKLINAGTTWNQISKWSNNNNLAGLNVSVVHADQHGMAFGNGSSTIMVFGNDGGAYYSNDSAVSITSRNIGFNTSQFYTVGVGPTTAFNGDYFAGGLQDNGTQLFQNANVNGVDNSVQAYGGDGAYTFLDQDGTDKYMIRNYVYNSGINLLYLDNNVSITINNESLNNPNGAFINPQALDSNLDILYSNYSSGGNSIIRRYSGIKSQATVQGTNLTNPEMDSTPTAFTVSPYTTSSSTVLVGTILGDVFKIENAESAAPIFTELELANVIVGSISDIEFGQSENDIFVTIHNYGVQSIWYTSDGGATWLPKEGDLPDMPVKAILQNPLNLDEVIIGTELGVWFTTNFSSASPNWNQAFNGMSNVKVMDLDLRDDNMVFAATYGRGVFSGEFKIDPNGDADGDGITNDVDNCLNTPNPDQADTDGNGIGDACQDTDGDGILDINDFTAQDNISVEVISERCEGQNNGQINVHVNETYVTYTVTITGPSVNLSEQLTTNDLSFENLAVGGPYTVCVSVNEYNHVQCSEVNIDAAETIDLEVTGRNSNDLEINISKGTAPYTVTLNNEVILVTSQDHIILNNLSSGLLEIKTAVACEGTFAKQINIISFKASPNPVTDNLQIILPNNLNSQSLPIKVYDINGRIVFNKTYSVLNKNKIYIPFQTLVSGVYFVNIESDSPQTIKILKK